MQSTDLLINGQPKPPAPSGLRWMILLIISVAMFSNYYVYDSIAPIADMLKSDLGFSDENIGLMNTAYSVAAVIILLIGGIVVDKYGTGKATFFFGAVCSIAAIVNALSSDFYVMVAARFLLGLGAEPLIVAVTAALAKWFKGKELSFAFGVNLTIARLGQVSADLSPTWAKSLYEKGWHEPLVLAAGIGLLCAAGAFTYFWLENRALKRYSLGEAGGTDKLVLKDLFKFDSSFWFTVALCVTFYSAIFPFRTFSIKFFMENFDLTRQAAGQLNSSLPFASMIATPIFGLIVDKMGKRATMMFVGAVLIAPVYVMMAYKVAPVYIPMAMMGIAFSLIPAVMWPSVAYIVEERRLGTAYAVMTLVQQIGVAGMNWLIGKTNDVFGASAAHPEGYAAGMWIFSSLCVFAFIFAFLLRRKEMGPDAHGLETIRA